MGGVGRSVPITARRISCTRRCASGSGCMSRSTAALLRPTRCVEALTGEAARQWFTNRDEKLREAASVLKATPDEVPARVAALVEDRRRLERELAEAKKALALGGGGASAPAGPEQVGGVNF